MRLLVIVPTFNERDNLPTIVAALLSLHDLRVLVVDDGSPDGTGAVADTLAAANRGRVSVVHRTGPRGLGLSYIDGMQYALRTDAARICQMDADLSHNPADVPRLLEASANADLVIGSRYVPGGRVENWPRRRVLSAASPMVMSGRLPGFRSTTAPVAFVAGGARRSNNCRSVESCRTGTRSRSS
jgi:dolichol-phosphate mannosyltransferase